MTRPNQGLSSLAPGGGKMRDPGNEVVFRTGNSRGCAKSYSTVAALERSSLIGPRTVNGCKGHNPIRLLMRCHVALAAFTFEKIHSTCFRDICAA